MPLVCLCYAWRDQAVAAEVAGRLRAAGAEIIAEAEAEQFLTPRQRGDGVAARVKQADAVAVIVSDTPEGRGQARRATRAALFYDKRVAPARLDPHVEFDSIARDPATRIGTPYAHNSDAAAAKVFAVSDLRPADDPDPEPTLEPPATLEGEAEDAEAESKARASLWSKPPEISEEAMAAYVAEVMRLATAGIQERLDPPIDFDESEMDDVGFPKTPAAMLARWRQVEASKDVRDVEEFLIAYANEPYFSLRAAEEISERRLENRRAMGVLSYRAVVGMVVAGLLVWGVSAACGSGRCGFFGGVDTAAAPATLQEAQREVAQLRGARRALEAERKRMLDQIRELRAERDKLRRDLRQRATVDVDALQAENAALRRELDGLKSALAIAQASIGGGDADALRAAQETIAQKDRQIAELRGTQERLREAAQAARSQYRQLVSQGGQTNPAALQGAETTIAALRADLRRRDQRINALTRELEQAKAAAQQQRSYAASSVTLSPGEAADAAALSRLLKVARDELERAYRRRLASLPPGRVVKGPYLTKADVRLMQGCLRDVTGAPAKVDGLWGRLTSAALLAVGSEDADAVAACLKKGAR